MLLSSLLHGQELSFFEKINDNKLKFYFDETGEICSKKDALYYRITSIDTNNLAFKGKTIDYYKGGTKSYECIYQNGVLNGKVFSYYKNGTIKSEGYFKNNVRDSIWRYYYKNAKIEKVLHYEHGDLYFKEYYKKNGKPIFIDGNGKYSGCTYVGKRPILHKISGEIVDGKQDGKWKFSCSSSTIARIPDPVFKKGEILKDMKFNTSISGFVLNENVDVFNFASSKPHIKFMKFSEMLKYKGSNSITKIFIPELIKNLNKISEVNKLNNFLCFVNFMLTKDNNIKDVIIFSSTKRCIKPIEDYLSSIKEFETFKPNGKPTGCAIYLPILRISGKIIIPKYAGYGSTNVLDLIPEDSN